MKMVNDCFHYIAYPVLLQSTNWRDCEEVDCWGLQTVICVAAWMQCVTKQMGFIRNQMFRVSHAYSFFWEVLNAWGTGWTRVIQIWGRGGRRLWKPENNRTFPWDKAVFWIYSWFLTWALKNLYACNVSITFILFIVPNFSTGVSISVKYLGSTWTDLIYTWIR